MILCVDKSVLCAKDWLSITMAKFAPPENFDFQKPEGWGEWKTRFLRYRLATELNKKDEEVQVASLLYAMGREAEVVFKQLDFQAAADQKVWATVIEKLDAYFEPQKNHIHHRAQFHRRKQRQGETNEQYIRALYELVDACGYEAAARTENLRDQLVVGISNSVLSKELQMTPDLTLESAVKKVRQSEAVDSQLSEQSSTPVSLEAVSKKKFFRYKHKGPSTHKKDGPARSTSPRCPNCGRGHGKDVECPAAGRKCYRCGSIGHYKKFCHNKKVHEVAKEDAYFLGEVHCPQSDPPWMIDLVLRYNGGTRSKVQFKVDCGADVSVMCYDTYQTLCDKPKLASSNHRLFTPQGQLKCHGYFRATTQYRGEEYTFQVYVTDGGSNLLSRGVAQSMGILEVHLHEVDSAIFGDIGQMRHVKPVTLHLRPDYKPYHVNAPRNVPVHLRDKIAQELDWMCDKGIIRKVTEPTEWCAPISTPVKKDGSVRICVDLRQLNKALMRERYPLPTVDDIRSRLTGSTCFTKLDASKGYWQIPLSEESQKLTTFITSQGRFCFTRMPFGICVASEIFQRVMTEMLEGIDGVECSQDDVLVHGKGDEGHDLTLQATLDRVKDSGLKLNKKKCVFKQPEIGFLGHLFNEKGMSVDPEKVQAIVDMPPPNADNLRSVLGTINYLGQYLPNLQIVMKPLNDLLKQDTEFCWGPVQQEAYDKVKQMVTSAPVLGYYDPSLPTVVSADASSYGVGGAIFQDHEGQLKPIAFCSRLLSKAEQNYAQIEKECLASAWVCEKFSMYLTGLDKFKLETDHKPLVPLMNNKDIDKCPVRVQRLLLRLMPFNFVAEHVPGKKLIVADLLSRIPTSDPGQEVHHLVEEIETYVQAKLAQLPMSQDKLQQIRVASAGDPVVSRAIEFTVVGWPRYVRDVPKEIRHLWSVRAQLSVVDGLLVYRDRIVVPESLRTEILSKIHDGHWGITKCRERAAEAVWWPGLSADIERIVKTCSYCQEHATSQRKEPLIASPTPDGPWQRIAADLCQLGSHYYLVVIDYYSRYLEIAHLTSQSSQAVIAKLKSFFARWGIPMEMVTDNGPAFASAEFARFCVQYGFIHTTSSPGYPQSNGEAEIGVKIAKKIIRQEDPFTALMVYRATPLSATRQSPAQLIMGRRLNTRLPMLPKKLEPEWPDRDLVYRRDNAAKETYKGHYDNHHGVRSLSPLRPGDDVRVRGEGEKSWHTRATVRAECETPRSYMVETNQGSVLRRNRRHLLHVPPTVEQPPAPDEHAVADPSQERPFVSQSVVLPSPTVECTGTSSRSDPVTPRPVRNRRAPKRLIEEDVI